MQLLIDECVIPRNFIQPIGMITLVHFIFHSFLEQIIHNIPTSGNNDFPTTVEHDKKQPAYEDDEISIGDGLITKHVTTEALE